jgi:uridine kinase
VNPLKNIFEIPEYLLLLEKVKNLYAGDKPKIIAIDGRCGIGKSTLAFLLKQEVDCNLFHLDDFFLPFEMKTIERLSTPGGNIYYERFKEEVLTPLLRGESVVHQPYNCQIRALDEPIHTKLKKLTIVEGVYSLHPSLQSAYDYKIFLTMDKEVQLERIRKRSGEKKLQDFINKWIPMEEHYFNELKIEEQCHLSVDTSNIG